MLDFTVVLILKLHQLPKLYAWNLNSDLVIQNNSYRSLFMLTTRDFMNSLDEYTITQLR